MKIMQTICEQSEVDFDSRVNKAIADGWVPLFETYRVTGFALFEKPGLITPGVNRNGTWNSIILIKGQ